MYSLITTKLGFRWDSAWTDRNLQRRWNLKIPKITCIVSFSRTSWFPLTFFRLEIFVENHGVFLDRVFQAITIPPTIGVTLGFLCATRTFAGADHVEAMKFRRCYDCNPANGRRSKLGMAVRDNGTASKSAVNRGGNRIPPSDFPSVCPADCHI